MSATQSDEMDEISNQNVSAALEVENEGFKEDDDSEHGIQNEEKHTEGKTKDSEKSQRKRKKTKGKSKESSLKRFPHYPVIKRCTECGTLAETAVEYKIERSAFKSCVALIGSCLLCGCCFLPFFTKSMKSAYHKCSKCGNRMGVDYHTPIQRCNAAGSLMKLFKETKRCDEDSR